MAAVHSIHLLSHWCRRATSLTEPQLAGAVCRSATLNAGARDLSSSGVPRRLHPLARNMASGLLHMKAQTQRTLAVCLG